MIRGTWIITGITVLVLLLFVSLWPRHVSTAASDIELVIRPYADVLGPPTTVTFSNTDLYIWWGDNALVLRRNDHWYIAGIVKKGESTVPPLFVVLLIQAIREKQKQGTWNVRPLAPWSETVYMPEEALHPEVK